MYKRLWACLALYTCVKIQEVFVLSSMVISLLQIDQGTYENVFACIQGNAMLNKHFQYFPKLNFE